MLKKADDYIFFKNLDHVYIEASQSMVDVTVSSGLPEDLIGRTVYDLFPRKIADMYYREDERVFCGEALALQKIFPTIDPRGNHGWVDCRVFPIHNELGQVTGLFGIARDVTALEKAKKIHLENGERLSLAALHSGIGIWDFDVQTGEMVWDESMFALHDICREDFIGVDDFWEKSLHPDDFESTKREFLSTFREKKSFDKEYRVIWPNGDVHVIKATGKLFFDESGEPVRLLGISTDITEQRAAEVRLKLAASVFSHTSEGIMITDIDGNIVEVNDTFTRITGYDREEVIGQSQSMFDSGIQAADFYDAMWHSLLANGEWYGEVWNRHKNGEAYAVTVNISAVRDDSDQVKNYVASFDDITLIRSQQRHLEHITLYDSLTDLPNSVLLSNRLSYALLHCRRADQLLAVAFLDIDGFKSINDQHGHEVGDKLLIIFAKRIAEALREGDTLARISGDEFIVLLPELEKITDCLSVLDRILRAAATPVVINDVTLNVSASIGVAIYPHDDVHTDELIRHANQAMYLAKQAGRNSYQFFDAHQELEARARREELKRIRMALDQKEFVLHYQPKVDMRAGTVIGAEALIRWQHPERDLLPPAAFLPVIENHVLSIALGEWVIDTALCQIATWQAMGLDLPVSVNIGTMQLQDGDFLARLTEMLASHPQVEPHDLDLEVLETSAVHDMDKVSATMKSCMELGVSFSLDDFGTGYSSLTYLRRLPANMIKIDQSFIRNMLEDEADLAIVIGVIELSKAFQRTAIAEGVETIAHGVTLLQLGCDMAQGYGIAKPMPAANIPEWVANWRPDDSWQAQRSLAPPFLADILLDE
jgi:diguanylate cyclase (GGDEF)-like protein/PAS domain S-box-containing protein